MSSTTKVPRATLAVTMLDDPDYIELCQSDSGRQALQLFSSLLMAAKVQKNGGVFKHSLAVIAAMCKWPAPAFQEHIQVIIKLGWLKYLDSRLEIRNFVKWNTWGGNRDGAGRPIKSESKGVKPASASVSDAEKTTTLTADKPPSDNPQPASKPRKPAWAQPWIENLKARVNETRPDKEWYPLVNSWGGKFTHAVVEQVVISLGDKKFESMRDMTGWVIACLQRQAAPKDNGRQFVNRDLQGQGKYDHLDNA